MRKRTTTKSMTPTEVRFAMAREMSEKELSARVERLSKEMGYTIRGADGDTLDLSYHTYSSKKSRKGFPDWVMVKPNQGRVLFLELKREREKLKPEQELWASALRACPGVEYYVFKPSDLMDGTVARILSGPKKGAT